MSVQRFFAPTTRQAMQQVRERLGDDAMVLSNRSSENGVEVVALASGEVEQLIGTASSADDSRADTQLAREVAHLRQLLQHSGKRKTNKQDQLWQQMRVAGLSERLAQSLLTKYPGAAPENWLAQQLVQQLQVASRDKLLEPGVVVLIGPTGVGKTMTALKMAARYASFHGSDDVVLINTDIYRVGASEQMRAYCERLSIDMHVLQAGYQFEQLRQALRGKRLVIVDTPGFSARDERLVAQVERLCVGAKVTPVLLLGASFSAEALDDMASAYRDVIATAGGKLTDVIVTKKDEAPRLGPLVDVLIRHQLCLHYLCDGQNVSDDVEVVDKQQLVTEVLAAKPRENHAEAAPQLHRILQQTRALGDVLASLRQHASGFTWMETAWALRLTSTEEQKQHQVTDSLHGHYDVKAFLWHGGAHRNYTVHGLDANGLPLSCSWADLSKSEFASHIQKLTHYMDAHMHLFQRLPGARARGWMRKHGQYWISQATANNRVWYAGEKRSLSAWQAIAESTGGVTVRHRGRLVHVSLYRLPVSIQESIGQEEAWFGTIRDRNSGRKISSRYWLLSAALTHDEATGLISRYLRLEAMSSLIDRAYKLLCTQTHARPGIVTDKLAGVIATLVSRLEGIDSEWTLTLRTQLMNLSGLRKRGAGNLLEAIICLLTTRDALQQIMMPTSLPEDASDPPLS